jgi:hypothetical protein
LSNRIFIANISVALIGTPPDYSSIDFTVVFLENEEGENVLCHHINGSFSILEDVCPCKKGDCDKDCDIDVFDLDILGQAWGTSNGNPRFVKCHDTNDDDIINIFDLDGFAQVWGAIYCDCLPCVAPPWTTW